MAFLALWEGDFNEALKYYARARRGDTSDARMVTGVLAFLEHTAENNPDRPEVHFALGIVNDAFFDAVTANGEYDEFIRAAGSDRKFAALVNYAQTRLPALQQRLSQPAG